MFNILKSKTQRNLLLFIIVLITASSMWMLNQQLSQTVQQRILQATTYTTSSTRLQLVNSVCVGKNRSTMISQGAQAQTDSNKASFAAQFQIDSNLLFGTIIAGNYGSLQPMFTNDIKPYVLFIGPYIVGLLIILFIWPFLCCCCCCPGCCPSKCCQKNQNQQYTKCQLLWPGIVLIIALLLACVTSIVGFTRANGFSNGLSNTVCSTAIFLDDFLNGNVTQDQSSFFAGVNTLLDQLTVMNNSIDGIKTEIQKLQPSGAFMTNVLGRLSTAKSDVSKIPTGTADQQISLSYATPINVNAPSGGPLVSTFKPILGKQSTTASDVGATYAVLSTLQSFMSTLSSAASSFAGSVNGFKDQIGSVQSSINGVSGQINGVLDMIKPGFTYVDPALNGISIGVSVYFGIVIGFTVLGIIGCLLMSFCDKFKCRYLIYFSCIILFVIGIIGFLLSTIFSVMTPVLYYSCEFVDYSLASPSNFKESFGSLMSLQMVAMITTCFPGQDGNLLKIIAPTIQGTLNNALTSINSLNVFNASQQNGLIDTPFNLMGTHIDQYYKNVISDLDSTNTNILKRLANSGNFPACVSLAADSWIPSTNSAQTGVNCNIAGGTATTSCADADFDGRANGCVGCMNTYQFYLHFTTVNIAAHLGSRYSGSADCTTFNNQLTNTINNYYDIKQSVLSNVQARYTTATTSVGNVKTDITTTIPNMFTSISNQLKSIAPTITDPKYGLMAGLSCLLIGENIIRVSKVLCTQAFNNIYFMMLILGISSFGILFAMCCTVCAGVRHFKHSQRLGKAVPAFDDAMDEGTQMKINSKLNAKY